MEWKVPFRIVKGHLLQCGGLYDDLASSCFCIVAVCPVDEFLMSNMCK